MSKSFSIDASISEVLASAVPEEQGKYYLSVNLRDSEGQSVFYHRRALRATPEEAEADLSDLRLILDRAFAQMNYRRIEEA